MKKVTILNFSARKEGNCAKIAQYISVHSTATTVCKYVVDRRIGPCGDCDYECLRPNECCPNVTDYQKEVMNSVMNSDVTYLIVPNYCGFPCANYLAYNERSVGFFNMDRAVMQQYMDARKRFIIVSNSESEVFRRAMEQQAKQPDEVLYLKSSKYAKRSIAGDILDSPEAAADLYAFLDKE